MFPDGQRTPVRLLGRALCCRLHVFPHVAADDGCEDAEDNHEHQPHVGENLRAAECDEEDVDQQNDCDESGDDGLVEGPGPPFAGSSRPE